MSQNEMKTNLFLQFILLSLGLAAGARAELRKPAAIQRIALLYEVPKQEFSALNLCFSPENLDSYQNEKNSKHFDQQSVKKPDCRRQRA